MGRIQSSGNGVIYLTKRQVKLLGKGKQVSVNRKELKVKLQLFTGKSDVMALKGKIEALEAKLKQLTKGAICS